MSPVVWSILEAEDFSTYKEDDIISESETFLEYKICIA